MKLKIKDKEYVSKFNCVHDEKNTDLSLADRKLVHEKAMQLQGLYKKVNTSIDSINRWQALLKSDSIAYKKNKNMQKFNDELQKIKGEYTATKKASIFADEERLRERVSELYGTFCNMQSKPNETQLKAIEVLQNDYKQQEDKFQKALTMHLPKVKMQKEIK